MAKRSKVSAFVLSWLGLAASANAQYLPPAGPMGGSTYPAPGMMPPPGYGPSGMMPAGYQPGPGGPMMGMPGAAPMPVQGPPGPGGPTQGLPELPAEVGSLEGLAPNAFTALPDSNTLKARLEYHLEYLILWYKPATLPTTLTTGSLDDATPGALDQPGTRIVNSGTQPGGASSALRTSFTYWLAVPEVLGIETSFMVMEQRTRVTSFTSDANGTILIARPFTDLNFNAPSADPRLVPGLERGTASDNVTTRLMGAESNLKWNITGPAPSGPSLYIFGGPRWLRLDERYRSHDVSIDLPEGQGVETRISDDFTTFNNIFGGQVGSQIRFRNDRFTFDVGTKIGVGRNEQTLKISGNTTVLDPVNGNTIDPQGFYAQNSNIGIYRRNRVSVIPELDLGMSFALTETAKFTIGYTIFDVNHVLRPGDQIDTTLSPPIPLPDVPSRPSLTIRETNFWTQSLNIGFAFDY